MIQLLTDDYHLHTSDQIACREWFERNHTLEQISMDITRTLQRHCVHMGSVHSIQDRLLAEGVIESRLITMGQGAKYFHKDCFVRISTGRSPGTDRIQVLHLEVYDQPLQFVYGQEDESKKHRLLEATFSYDPHSAQWYATSSNKRIV